LIGGAVAGAGAGSISWGVEELLAGQLSGLTKVFVFLLASVGIGFAGGYLFKKASMVLLRNASRKINRPIRRAQLITTALLSFAHGANDSQKQMGVITMALLSAGMIGAAEVPLWVRILCAIAIAVGTVGGGWRIMKTLGRRNYPIKPIDALDSQVTSSGSILLSTLAGAPISSTQTVASSIMGVGAAERVKMVQWSVGKHMAVSWLVTIPASALLSGLVFIILDVVLNI
jgi:PiT family inorganic phosphate transporter